MEKLKRYFIQLDLFSPPLPNDGEEVPFKKHTNTIATRIYLVLVLVGLLIIILLSSVPGQSEQIEMEWPTLSEYESYPSDARCPCREYSIEYSTFISSDPSYHPVCSSAFVSDEWISALYYGDEQSSLPNDDFRSIGFSFFQTLSMLCRLSRIEVNDILASVNSESFFSLNLLSRSNFIAQISADTNRFRTNALQLFQTRISIISQLIGSSFLINSLHTSMIPVVLNPFQDDTTVRVDLVRLEQEDGSYCNCTVTFSCETPVLKISVPNNSWSNGSFAIPGLKRRCMPIDTCLHSTLECFFNQTCLDTILSYIPITFNHTVLVLSKSSQFHPETKVETLSSQMMVDDWAFNSTYEKYFERCAPKSCFFLVTIRLTVFQIVTELIGSLSGLCTILRIIVIIVLRIVHHICQKRSAPTEIPVQVVQTRQYTRTERIRQLMRSIGTLIREFNLFKRSNETEEEHEISRQRIATRVYIALLIITLCVLIFYTSLTVKLFTETVINPSESTYSQLQSSYSSSLRCQCSQMSIDYKKFVSIETIFHPVCSSDLVSSSWIDLLYENYRPSPSGNADLFSIGGGLFQLLNTFCGIANQTISDSLQTYIRRQLVSSEVLLEDFFNVQLRTTTEKWREGILYNFVQVIDLFRVNMQTNQLLSNGYNFGWYFIPFPPLDLYFKSFIADPFFFFSCSCALSAFCAGPLTLIDNQYRTIEINGFTRTCTAITSITQSNFQSFSNQSLIDQVYTFVLLNSNNFTLRPLVASNIHPIDEIIQSIADRSFVDQWIEQFSFDDYYKMCAPPSCTYLIIRHSHPVSIFISTISIIGGLATLLTILMKIILILLHKSQHHFSCRAMKQWFSNFNDPNHLSSRLNVLFIIVTLLGLYLSNAFNKYSQINEVMKDPSMESYFELVHRYSGRSIDCPCSQSSIFHNSFINISVNKYHQVCSKPFLTYQWLDRYLPRVDPRIYDPISFFDVIPVYFTLIDELCRASQKTVNTALLQFISTSLIQTSPNPSPHLFQSIIQIKIEKFKRNLSQSLIKTLELLREMTHINQLLNIFRTNWRFAPINSTSQINDSNTYSLKIIPVLYQQCDCGLTKNCIKPMIDLMNNSIAGLMIGCYPLEALLQSSFQCLYDSSCFQTITSDTIDLTETSSLILNASIHSQYHSTTRIEDILNHLFIEEWTTNISYEKYYNVCAPSSCSFSSQTSIPPFQIIANLLGLYGGLTILVEHILVPIFIQFFSLCKRSFRRVHNQHQ